MKVEDIKLSYSILCCNEAKELDVLLRLLLQYKKETDEIVVVLDNGNVTNEVNDVIKKINEELAQKEFVSNLHIYEHALNKDFAAQKNFANSKCTGDYIFNIDADEAISEWFIQNIHAVLAMNPDTETFYVPRINIVNGLTQDDIQRWQWNVNEKGWVQFPDFQQRIYKNKPEIKWYRPVHEILEGHTNQGFLPTMDEFCIMHIKDIIRQRRQNEFYSTI